MDALWHSRLTTATTVVVAGMAAGHVTMPYAPSAGPGARVAFWSVVVAVGALRGWRDGVVRDLSGRPLGSRVALTAFAAALLALAGYWAMHGAP